MTGIALSNECSVLEKERDRERDIEKKSKENTRTEMNKNEFKRKLLLLLSNVPPHAYSHDFYDIESCNTN